MDTPPFHLRLPANLDSVSSLLDALEAYAEEVDLSPGIAARLVLVAEEIAANVAMHGTGASFFELRVTAAAGALAISIEDDGPEYDPLSRTAPDIEGPLEDREVGGLGVHLVREMTRDARYERAGGLNRLSCALPLS